MMSGYLASFAIRMKTLRRLRRARAQGNEVDIAREDFGRIRLRISGSSNVIRIGKLAPGSGVLELSVYADGCRIEIGEGISIGETLSLVVGFNHPNFGKAADCQVRIGERTSFGSTNVMVVNSHARLSIGRDCMFAFGVNVYHTDMHPIYDAETERLVNHVGEMHIGDRVWIGAHATILKNSVIADGCIVGWGSVLAGRFEESNTLIAGNPAREVSGRKVSWRSRDPNYIANGLIKS